MKNPTSESMYKVIERLRPYADESLDMGNSHVTKCGTPHCFAGYYALACKREGRTWTTSEGLVVSDLREYDSGAELMARDLGFRDWFSFEYWVSKDMTFWNGEEERKEGVGCYSPFYSNSFSEAKNLSDIILHLEGVAARLEAKEKKKSIRGYKLSQDVDVSPPCAEEEKKARVLQWIT